MPREWKEARRCGWCVREARVLAIRNQDRAGQGEAGRREEVIGKGEQVFRADSVRGIVGKAESHLFLPCDLFSSP